MRAARTPLFAALVVTAAGVAVLGHHAYNGLQVATGYAAKLTCSLASTSGQPPEVIQKELLDRVLSPVSGLLTMRPADCCASAEFAGLVRARAVVRRDLGCTLLAGRAEQELAPLALPARPSLDVDVPWPFGDAGPSSGAPAAVGKAIDDAFHEIDSDVSGRIRQTKAVVVAHRGKLVAERYAAGYGQATPMLSWSMAKSVLAAVVGIAVDEGRLSLHEPAPVPEWSAPQDPRRAITLDQLLRMSSGLEFDETYGAVNDVSRMLFTSPDTGAYAARSRPAAEPDAAWSYSSGTSNIVARMLRDSFDGDVAAFVRYSREKLFDPASITSAFFEHDASGTPVGSSFVFMTARDWARFGELHRNDGIHGGRRILPDGWVRYVTTPTPRAPLGQYGAHWWLNRGEPERGDANDPPATTERPWPSLPPDAYAARGYSGQWLLVIPSHELVIVRLGIAVPDDGDDGTVELAGAVIAALRGH